MLTLSLGPFAALRVTKRASRVPYPAYSTRFTMT